MQISSLSLHPMAVGEFLLTNKFKSDSIYSQPAIEGREDTRAARLSMLLVALLIFLLGVPEVFGAKGAAAGKRREDGRLPTKLAALPLPPLTPSPVAMELVHA